MAELQRQRRIRRQMEAGVKKAISGLRDILSVRTLILDQEL